jgi:hypothetical protein
MRGTFGNKNVKSLDEEGNRVSLPEKDLWVSVLSRAALDVVRNSDRLERDQACSFFLKGGRHFRNVCDMAGKNPDYVQEKMRKYILRNQGWNVDIIRILSCHITDIPKMSASFKKERTGLITFKSVRVSNNIKCCST